MAIDYTWNLGGLPREMKEAGTGELDFYPYPAGPHGNKTYVVPDYIGVSSVTEHPEAAFELMKWMSFGREGWLTRLELLEELGQGVSGFPVANYPEVWEVIQEQLPLPGLAYVIDTLDNTYSDVFKWLPGIDEFHNWAHNDRIWERLETGEANAADLAVEMEQRATQIVQDALKLLK